MVKALVSRATNKVIAYSFLVGIVVALILGLVSARLSLNVSAVLTTVLILAGVLVGFFNITPTEQKDYILFVTALVVVTSLSGGMLRQVHVIGPHLESVLKSIMAFILPSVIIVGIKAVMNLARD